MKAIIHPNRTLNRRIFFTFLELIDKEYPPLNLSSYLLGAVYKKALQL